MSDRSDGDDLAAIPSVVFRLLATRASEPQASDTGDIAVADTQIATKILTNAASLTSANRFERVGLLGEGGMGRVEHVRDHDLLRDVAVKHLRPELTTHATLLGQFLWEARVTAFLDHPNIVPVHDIGRTTDGQLYFTMKLVRGQTLESCLERARTDAQRAPGVSSRLRWFLQLCNAIAYAHARGVLHRDLKPGNVMIGEFGEVLVTDWGLALPLPGSAGDRIRAAMPEGLAEISAGTPMYMSPEQARAETLDARSDVFTLGAILYELVALRRAFEGDNPAAVLAKVLGADDLSLDTKAPGLTPSLLSIVRKALARDPSERYATVRDLAADVETVMDGRTPRAENASIVKRVARYYVSHDPALSQLRVMHIDLLFGSGFFFGIGLGMLAGWSRYAWIAFALCVLTGITPAVRWVQLAREQRRLGSSDELANGDGVR